MGKQSSQARVCVDRIYDLLASAPAGLHRLGEPAFVFDSELPQALRELYQRLDGAEIYQETLLLCPSCDIQRDGEIFVVGEHLGDELLVSSTAELWRHEKDSGDRLPESSDFLRWLWGMIEAEGAAYDDTGEFADGVFDESGELTPEALVRQSSAVLKRDKSAVGARWRMSRGLTRMGREEKARDELEIVVAQAPGFAWAWYDLARLAERCGQIDAATNDMVTAAKADSGADYAGFFWAHAARLARRLGADERRRDYADRALAIRPQLAREQREAAVDALQEGGTDIDSARERIELALAIDPRDLAALDIAAKINQTDGDKH